MKAFAVALSIVSVLTTAAPAQPAGLGGGLAGVDFLVGRWVADASGKVAETGGTSSGVLTFTPEAQGAVLLRKDHVTLSDASGKPSGAFDIIMMIYPEAGTLHADYADGQHVIHYTAAAVTPGHAVTFTSAASPQAPTFKLAFTLVSPRTLGIDFSMAPPGGADFHPIATGTAHREG
jgi:hypothetical protein